MKKPERINNALKELSKHLQAIDYIQDELNTIDFMDDLTDEQKTQKEHEETRHLRVAHGELTSWADRFMKLMRNNEPYFGDAK